VTYAGGNAKVRSSRDNVVNLEALSWTHCKDKNAIKNVKGMDDGNSWRL